MLVLSEQLSKKIIDGLIDVEIIKDSFESEVLTAVMKLSRFNQLRAAKIYGVSRGTFRALLKKHFGDQYFRCGYVHD